MASTSDGAFIDVERHKKKRKAEPAVQDLAPNENEDKYTVYYAKNYTRTYPENSGATEFPVFLESAENEKPICPNVLYFHITKTAVGKCKMQNVNVANLKIEKEEHQQRAEDLRKLMKEDLMRAAIYVKFECLTYDMEKTLPLPRIPTSIVFYKRQLWLYNCGIHSGSKDIGHCYIWIEGEAGRGSQEVGSCLVQFIKNKLDPRTEHLVLWSDCCGGQNRNIKIVLMMKAILNSHPTLKTITLKYLESGHTFLPNDTDFSKIESQLKFHERIYTTNQYMNIIKSCKKKKPLVVYRMENIDFFSVKHVEKNIVNRKNFISKTKVNWLKTKQKLIKKDAKLSIFMKSQLSEEFEELNLEKKKNGRSLGISEADFTTLWPNGKDIPQAKLDDLKSMFNLIPRDCLGFYKSLRGNTNLVDDVDGYGGTCDFEIEDDINEEVNY